MNDLINFPNPPPKAKSNYEPEGKLIDFNDPILRQKLAMKKQLEAVIKQSDHLDDQE